MAGSERCADLPFLSFGKSRVAGGSEGAQHQRMGSQSETLRRRAAEFALAVLKFIRRLPRDVASDSIIRQVARSAAGVSANYRAACFARSRAEFVSRLAVAVEEADETNHWLWMAGQLGLGTGKELERLLAEGHELQAILCASLGTARRNLRRDGTSK